MIAALLRNDEEGKSETVMFILEPGNIAKLELGQPIVKALNDFFPEGLPERLDICLSYTPDIVWVGEQLAKGKDIADTIRDSMSRPKVYSRELDPEALKKGQLKGQRT